MLSTSAMMVIVFVFIGSWNALLWPLIATREAFQVVADLGQLA